MKIKIISVSFLFLLLISFCACANKNKSETVTSGVAKTGTGLSENIYEYQLKVDGKVLKFPLKYSDFTKLGFMLTEQQNKNFELEPRISYALKACSASDKELQFTVYLQNTGKKNVNVNDGVIVGVEFDINENKYDYTKVELPKSIILSKSTHKEVVNAYGEPNETNTEENGSVKLNTFVYYESEDTLSNIELGFDVSSNVLSYISISNK